MPLVLTQNDATESGHEYADVLGVSYEYPVRYRNLIKEGRRFVYYRGRRTGTGATQPQVYLGTGLVGQVEPSGTSGRLVCQIDDYEAFAEPVPFKVRETYMESGAQSLGSRAGLHFRQGARRISEPDFRSILEHAVATDPSAGFGRRQASVSPYASPETARLVDAIAMDQALDEATRTFPGAEVRRMPQNNPGFDIEVTFGSVVHYIEVKGTTKRLPYFFMSEGERGFSVAQSECYSLWVIYAISTDARRGTTIKRSGSVTEDNAGLVPTQWAGRLPM